MGDHQEYTIQKLASEIHNLVKHQVNGSRAFDESVYDRILKNLNSAVMSSPHSEDSRSELLKILERLEERVLTEAEVAIRTVGEDSNTFPSFRSYEAQEPRRASAFEQRHPTSPVSGLPNRRSWSSLSSITIGLNSLDGCSSPESSLGSTAESSVSEPPATHGVPKLTKTVPDVICFKRTVRKLEHSFVKCSPRTELLAGLKKSEEGKGERMEKSSVSPSLGSWVNSRTGEAVKRLQVIGRRGSGDKYTPLACKPLVLAKKASRGQLVRLPSPVFKRRVSPAPAMEDSYEKCSVKGSLHSVVRDGVANYNLFMDGTDELLIAREVRQDVGEDQEFCDKVFVFLSYRSREKGRRGWINWGSRDKPVVEVVGKMKVYNTLIPEMDYGGKNRHFLDSDYVIFEGRKVEAERIVPELQGNSSSRLSFSSWETPTKSPTPEKRGTPSKQCNSPSFLKEESATKTDSFRALEAENETTSYTEVGGVVTRFPIQVRKRSNSVNSSQLTNSSWESRLKRNNLPPVVDEPCSEMNVTVVLPTGEHGCPDYGVAGPSSILERWRSGGTCDCGGWDLGCGFTVLEDQRSVRCSAKAVQEQGGTVKLVVKGKKSGLAMKLAPLYDRDTFTISFRRQLSTIQAFGAAVAMLESRTKFHRMSVPDTGLKPVKKLIGNAPAAVLSPANIIPKLRKVYSLGCRNDGAERV